MGPMKYWLVKSEPNTWSWDDHVKKGTESWDGVRNHQAKQNLMAMRIGDKAFFYHSVNEKTIVGIVKVTKEYYPDPTAPGSLPWVCVDFKAIQPLKNPVSLTQIKADKRLADMVLVKNTRLSVQPVTPTAWKIICKTGGVKP